MNREKHYYYFFGCMFFYSVISYAEEAASHEFNNIQYKNLRFEEIWIEHPSTNLTDAKKTASSFKNLVVSKKPNIQASFGLQERLRTEYWKNFLFSRPDKHDDIYLLHRLRLHSDLRFNDTVRIFFELKNALANGRKIPGGRRTADVDELAIQNGFIDIKLPELFKSKVRIGRQEILFGKQRLLSPANWLNTRRSFDGFRLDTKVNSNQLASFWLRPVEVKKYDLNRTDNSTLIYGLYYQQNKVSLPIDLDLYFLGRHKKSGFITTNNIIKDERFTIGGRIDTTDINIPWGLEIEGSYQFGSRENQDISAWMFTAELAYFWRKKTGTPKIWLAFDLASGQSSNTNNITLFDPLFPTGHLHLGYIDLIGRFNIIDHRMGFSINPTKKISMSLEGHYFNRFERTDSLYSPGGATVIPGSQSTARNIGSEVDLLMILNMNKHWRSQLGYSAFFAGDFIEMTGADKTINFLYFALQYTF